MYAVFIVLLGFVLLTTILYLSRHTYEGFSAMSDQKSFGSKQITYFQEAVNKAVFVNPGIRYVAINKATALPDLAVYFKKFRDFIPRFMIDPNNPYGKHDKEFCKKAAHPRNLPKRERSATVGCGWYFSPDPAYPSVGVLGVRQTPLFTDDLPPNGTWYWNIPRAIEEEDIKLCYNIKTCDVMDIDGIRGVCGFCLSSGHAVPIDSVGNEKYPNNTRGACGVKVSKTAYECLNPPPTPIYTSDGVNCKQFGYASDDGNIRLYKKDECDSLTGNWYGNGECLKRKGGSFSWDCRSLNIPKPVVTTVCTPDNQGRLTRECLKSLATGVGFTSGGSILYMLKKNVNPTLRERQAMDVLASVGVAIPDSVLGSGETDAVSAGNVYKRIMDQIQRGNTEQIRNAAKMLAVGGGNFDICNIDPNATGPFAKYCAQQAFRRAGCQPAGSEYPNADVQTDKLWSGLTNSYKQLYAAMDNDSDHVEQKKAIQKCLGITVPDMKVKCRK